MLRVNQLDARHFPWGAPQIVGLYWTHEKDWWLGGLALFWRTPRKVNSYENNSDSPVSFPSFFGILSEKISSEMAMYSHCFFFEFQQQKPVGITRGGIHHGKFRLCFFRETWGCCVTYISNMYLYNNKHMGVSINGGTPKWLVNKGTPSKIDDLGVPPFMETPIWIFYMYLDVT